MCTTKMTVSLLTNIIEETNTAKPVLLRGHLLGQRKSGCIRQMTSWKRFHSCEIFYDGTKTKWLHKIRWSLEKDSIHMKFSMTGQEKYDLLIQETV